MGTLSFAVKGRNFRARSGKVGTGFPKRSSSNDG
jgi:hypothetical protein